MQSCRRRYDGGARFEGEYHVRAQLKPETRSRGIRDEEPQATRAGKMRPAEQRLVLKLTPTERDPSRRLCIRDMRRVAMERGSIHPEDYTIDNLPLLVISCLFQRFIDDHGGRIAKTGRPPYDSCNTFIVPFHSDTMIDSSSAWFLWFPRFRMIIPEILSSGCYLTRTTTFV